MIEIMCPSCHRLHRSLAAIAFREECEHCSADLHVCVTCRFHDAYVENECRETEAEHVADKRKRNLCEYWKPRPRGEQDVDDAAAAKARLAALFGDTAPRMGAAPSAVDEAKAKLDALFRKKE